jgi:hypothetical protein
VEEFIKEDKALALFSAGPKTVCSELHFRLEHGIFTGSIPKLEARSDPVETGHYRLNRGSDPRKEDFPPPFGPVMIA